MLLLTTTAREISEQSSSIATCRLGSILVSSAGHKAWFEAGMNLINDSLFFFSIVVTRSSTAPVCTILYNYIHSAVFPRIIVRLFFQRYYLNRDDLVLFLLLSFSLFFSKSFQPVRGDKNRREKRIIATDLMDVG